MNENGDLTFFSSVEEAQRYIEPVDVENNEYTAFDGEGYRLEIAIEERTTRVLWGRIGFSSKTVVLRRPKDAADASSDLRELLLKHLSALSHDVGAFADFDLVSLIEKARQARPARRAEK